MDQWMIDLIKFIVTTAAGILGGGLAGGIYSQHVVRKDAEQKAKAKQNATISALIGELGLAEKICQMNAKYEYYTFVHLPVSVSNHTAFAERHSYPRLADFQKELEQYYLLAVSINEAIDLRQTYQLDGRISSEVVGNLIEHIKKVCGGMESLDTIDSPTQVVVFPAFVHTLAAKLHKLPIN